MSSLTGIPWVHERATLKTKFPPVKSMLRAVRKRLVSYGLVSTLETFPSFSLNEILFAEDHVEALTKNYH